MLSRHLHQGKAGIHTCTRDLEEVVLLKLLEDATFDFHKLVRHEESQQSVIIGVDSNVQGDHLVYHDEGMSHYIGREHHELSVRQRNVIHCCIRALMRSRTQGVVYAM